MTTKVDVLGTENTLQAKQKVETEVINMNDFLRTVQSSAYRMAKLSTQNTEDALDIVQDAMMKLIQKYPHKPVNELKPLFYSILSSKLKDWHRKRVFRQQFHWIFSHDEEQGDPLENIASDFDQLPQEWLENQREMTDVLHAITTLSERQRQVLLLRQWQGFSVEETAQILKISNGSVKTHLHRANQAINSMVKDQHEVQS